MFQLVAFHLHPRLPYLFFWFSLDFVSIYDPFQLIINELSILRMFQYSIVNQFYPINGKLKYKKTPI